MKNQQCYSPFPELAAIGVYDLHVFLSGLMMLSHLFC